MQDCQSIRLNVRTVMRLISDEQQAAVQRVPVVVEGRSDLLRNR